VLGTDQVLAIRRASRDGELDPVLVPSAPRIARKVLALVANALFEDLEPVTVTLVGLHGARSLGHVDLGRPWVLHGGTDGELHGVRGAGLDLCDLCAAGALKSALVASEIGEVGRHVIAEVLPLGGVVLLRTSILADEFEGLGLLAISDEDIKEVVGRGELRNGGSGSEGKLHVGCEGV
jgi:hypothetical protein